MSDGTDDSPLFTQPPEPVQPASFLPISALFFSATILTWLIGALHGSVLWLIPVLSVVFAVVRRRTALYERYRIYHAQREASRQRLATHVETTEWLNHVLDKFWTVLEPIASTKVVAATNTILREKKPAFLVSQHRL